MYIVSYCSSDTCNKTVELDLHLQIALEGVSLLIKYTTFLVEDVFLLREDVFLLREEVFLLRKDVFLLRKDVSLSIPPRILTLKWYIQRVYLHILLRKNISSSHINRIAISCTCLQFTRAKQLVWFILATQDSILAVNLA